MNTQVRRKDREVTEEKEILRIADTAKILHMGLFDDGYPYVVPLHYGYAYEEGKFTFYMHGAREGHKLDLIRNNPNVCVELDCDVSLVSGGDVACRYGSSYASIIGRGRAEVLTDKKEKIRGLCLLMEHQTGRHFEITEAMAAGVAVIKVTTECFTAKERPAGGPAAKGHRTEEKS